MFNVDYCFEIDPMPDGRLLTELRTVVGFKSGSTYIDVVSLYNLRWHAMTDHSGEVVFHYRIVERLGGGRNFRTRWTIGTKSIGIETR